MSIKIDVNGTQSEAKAIFANVHDVQYDYLAGSGVTNLAHGNKLLTAVVDSSNDLVSPVYVSNVKHIFKANAIYSARYKFTNSDSNFDSAYCFAQHATEVFDPPDEYYGYKTLVLNNGGVDSSSPAGFDYDWYYNNFRKPTSVAYNTVSDDGTLTTQIDFSKSKSVCCITFEPPPTNSSDIKTGVALVVKVADSIKNCPFKMCIKGSTYQINESDSTTENTVFTNTDSSQMLVSNGAKRYTICEGNDFANSEYVTALGDNKYLIRAEKYVNFSKIDDSLHRWSKMLVTPTPLLWFKTDEDLSTISNRFTQESDYKLLYLDWLYAFDR